MKRVTMVRVVMALAILVVAAPAVRAEEANDATPAAATVLDQALVAVGQADGVAPATAQPCEDALEVSVFGQPALGCNFGAPRCSTDGQCDSWCFPLWGLCISGCCACT